MRHQLAKTISLKFARKSVISVEQVLKALAAGVPQEELLKEYPELEPEDIRATLAYAAELIAEEKVLPITVG